MTLGDFLKEAGSDRSPWNCSTLAADWCMSQGYPDFASRWREVVGNECEAVDLLPLWESDIGDGLPLCDGSQAGDIAVIRVIGFTIGAIFTGNKWAIKTPKGLFFIPTDHAILLKAWRP